jgi:hypothetical protein
MKKIVLLFAVFALAAPLSAADVKLNFNTSVIGGEIWVEVNYDASASGQLPRGFAFDMQLDNGAIFQAIDSYKENVFSIASDKGFGVYLDTIDFGADPNTIDDPGSPVAVAPDALPGIGSNGLTICMASLYDPCDVNNAPADTGLMFRVRVSQLYTALTCSEDDDTRGGVVFEDGSDGGLDSPTFQVAWGLAGQCYGDIDDNLELDTDDFSLFRKSWGRDYPHPLYHPGADLTRDGFVDTDDFGIFRKYWGKSTPGDCTVGGTWPPF